MKNFFLLLAAILLTVVTASAQCNGQIYKISAGKVMAYDTYGNSRGQVAKDAIDVDCNSSIGVLVTHTTGSVEIYDMYGNRKGIITRGGSRARFNGDEVLVTKSDGKIYRYDKYGNSRGTI